MALLLPWTKMRSLYMLLMMMVMTTVITADVSELSYSDRETALRDELFAEYNPDSLPSASTTLELGFHLLHFTMNDAQHYIEVDGWYTLSWNDPRLVWDEHKYTNISVLRVPPQKIWRPDIMIYSGVDWLNVEHISNNVHALIYPYGEVLHVPPAHLKSACVADLTYWPHDVHDCTIKLGSWVTDGWMLNITIKDDQFMMEDFQMSDTNMSRSEWELVSHNISRNVKVYSCCAEEYIDITFNMVVKRNAPALAYTFKLPAVGLGLLCLFVFLLPPAAGEKLVLSCLLLLMDLQFFIHTADVVQYSPTHIPIVVRLVSEQFILVLVSVMVSVVALRMARPPHGEHLFSWIMAPLRVLGHLLLLGKYADMSVNYHAVHGNDEVELGDSMTMPLDAKNKKGNGDWILIAAIVDRLFFIIYFFIITFSLMAYPSVQ
ncbi:unnamed protein product [Meganyctiphanes norvegica]|uniref:Neurotransmitter-gated ion-channel ligand-binding domain-containing protein n=1 Tax=Meganyctiphanes norvegica TaxID=48144 RepID=A0AAV2R7A2_MEGNR